MSITKEPTDRAPTRTAEQNESRAITSGLPRSPQPRERTTGDRGRAGCDRARCAVWSRTSRPRAVTTPSPPRSPARAAGDRARLESLRRKRGVPLDVEVRLEALEGLVDEALHAAQIGGA